MFFEKRINKMKKRVLTGVLTMLLILALSACTAAKGSIVILEDGYETSFTMILEEFTSDNKCDLPLAAGNVIQVEVDREEGQFALSVSGKNGSEPYTGNDLESGIFTVTVSESDEYVFRIEGKDATGKITVKNLGPEVE